MDITEYWATFVSIILGLGVADLLVNLHRLIHARTRVRWDALPLLGIGPILLFLTCATVLPRSVPETGVCDLRMEWAEGRRQFFLLFVLNQVFAWGVTLARGSVEWNLAATTRTIALALFLLLLFVRSRRVEWPAAIIVFVLLIARISTQPLH